MPQMRGVLFFLFCISEKVDSCIISDDESEGISLVNSESHLSVTPFI